MRTKTSQLFSRRQMHSKYAVIIEWWNWEKNYSATKNRMENHHVYFAHNNHHPQNTFKLPFGTSSWKYDGEEICNFLCVINIFHTLFKIFFYKEKFSLVLVLKTHKNNEKSEPLTHFSFVCLFNKYYCVSLCNFSLWIFIINNRLKKVFIHRKIRKCRTTCFHSVSRTFGTLRKSLRNVFQ